MSWPAWSSGSFYHDRVYNEQVTRSCKLSITSSFQQLAQEALGVPGLPVIFFAGPTHADNICRRLACCVWRGLAAGDDPFVTPLTDAEHRACCEWLQLSGPEVADRLAAEHVARAQEVMRRSSLQQLLDARSVLLAAAQLDGIAVSNQAKIRIRNGSPLATRPARPYNAQLHLHPALAAAMEADGSLPATSAAGIYATRNRAVFRMHNLYADLHEAVRWRDEQYFKAYGTCAPALRQLQRAALVTLAGSQCG